MPRTANNHELLDRQVVRCLWREDTNEFFLLAANWEMTPLHEACILQKQVSKICDDHVLLTCVAVLTKKLERFLMDNIDG